MTEPPGSIHDDWRKMRSAPEWCELLHLSVQNPPTGWRGRHELPWETPIGIVEFYERMCRSRLGMTAQYRGWITLMNIANELIEEEHRAGAAAGADYSTSLRTGEPINREPIQVQIALPVGEEDPGFFVEAARVPAVDDDFHLTYRDGDHFRTRSFRVASVVYFINRSAPNDPKTNRVRVNLARPLHPAGRAVPRQQEPTVCGHCGRCPNGFGFGFAHGVALCHTGNIPPDEDPRDCYRLVTIYGHRADGSCCP